MNSFNSKSKLRVGAKEYEIFRLDAMTKHGCEPARLPYSLKILLENLLRTENGRSVTAEDIKFLSEWKASAIPDKEIAFTPARVLMQDFTGVPAVVDRRHAGCHEDHGRRRQPHQSSSARRTGD